MIAIWHWCFGEDGTGRAFFLICFYSFFHVRHGGMKHVRIFQIHKWHCGMWWRWNVSGQEDSDGTVALFHNSKQEPCCSYWWGGNRDHVFFGKIFNLMYLDIRNRKQNLISNSGVTYVFQNGHMKQLTFVVFFHEIASCHTLSEHIKTSTLPTKELGWCVAWQPIGVKMLSIGHVAQGHTTCRKTVDSVDWWWWLWCIWGNSRARWCTRIWDNYTYHICIVRSWFDALLCHFACLSMLGLLQLRYSRATLISTRLVNGYYVMFLYDQINIDPSLTFTVPWLDVYYWSINLYILSFDWYLMIHFQPVTPHTPPLQLDLIRISGWWAHRTRPFIQTVGLSLLQAAITRTRDGVDLCWWAQGMDWETSRMVGMPWVTARQGVETRAIAASLLLPLVTFSSWSLFRSSMVQRMSPRLLFERRTPRFLARDHGMVEWERWKKSIHLAVFQCQSTEMKLEVWGAKLYFLFKGFNTAQ